MNKTRLIAARKPIQGLQRMYITSYGIKKLASHKSGNNTASNVYPPLGSE